jgi:hypothetical protein
MIYIILGMHKSGTTLISKMLHDSDVNMGDFDPTITYDQGNQYEREEFQKVNKDILGCEDANSTSVITPLNSTYQNTVLGDFIKEEIIKLNSSHIHWGFKDPRTCLTYNYWSQYLPEHKVIYVYRSPVEVWHHYQKNISKYRFYKKILVSCKAVNAWYVYNNEILDYINLLYVASENSYILEYSNFMKDDIAINELAEFVGVNLNDTRDVSLYRAKKNTDIWFKVYTVISKALKGKDVMGLYAKLNAKL